MFENCSIVYGSANPKLARKIAKYLNTSSCKASGRFSDGEVRIKLTESVRRKTVYVIQPTNPSGDNILELCFMIDAARRGSASEITAVVPYFGYARQDRTARPGEPISAAMAAGMIQYAGADRIVTIDLHSEQLTGAVTIPLDNLYASRVLIPKLKSYLKRNVVVVSPDRGGFKRANAYAKRLNASGMALIFKNRDLNVNDQTESQDIIGKVKGCDALIVDDIWSSGSTIKSAVDILLEKGANKIVVAVTHGLFAGKSLDIIKNPAIKKIFVTDTISHASKIAHNRKIEVVSIAELLAEAIGRIQSGKPLREIFDVEQN